MTSYYPDCTEACAAMPECSVCGKPKPPGGRSVAPAAANSYCDGFTCPGYGHAPRAGHLWPEEWREELERRHNEDQIDAYADQERSPKC